MDTMLRELYFHQAWADAEHWRALETHPGALDDEAVRKRLHHIHLVQRAFLAVAKGEPLQRRKLEEYASIGELKDEARRYHDDVSALLDGLSDARLAESVTIPWFKDPPCTITLAQALTQAAMHSHYHRGQNASRLRELGGAPPLTDFIVWLWKGRPEPQWP
jgi:uncharacterized damage-inducible protein DinB